MKQYYVYILYTEKHNKYYVGHTDNLERRLNEHNSGMNQSTKAYVPWKLLGYVEKASRTDAYQLEMKLKNLSQNRKLAFLDKFCKT